VKQNQERKPRPETVSEYSQAKKPHNGLDKLAPYMMSFPDVTMTREEYHRLRNKSDKQPTDSNT
jgi:hypothetical protein